MGNARVVFVPCVCLVILLLSFSLLLSEAREYRVGGRRNLWTIPTKPDGLEQWASKMRFLIGDSIEIKYDPKTDSVLQVTEDKYKTCNITNPIKVYNNGDSKIVLDHSGPYYFISGAQGHCQKGEKMVIRVLSAKHSGMRHDHGAAPATSPAISPSPARSPVGFLAPTPAPSGGDKVKVGALVVLVLVLVGLVLG